MRFLPDFRLYDDVAHCLGFARRIASTRSAPSGERTRFHFYWHGPLNRKARFALASFVATQDLESVEAWLWIDGATPQAPDAVAGFLGPLAPCFEVKTFDPEVEARGTPLEGARALLSTADAAARSDAFRFLALHHHGGVYVDMDTLFLRDLRPLLDWPTANGSFCYRWSGRGESSTSAIMRLERGSAAGIAFMEHFARLGTCHPRRAMKHSAFAHLDLLELPCAFFDPLWPHFDGDDRRRVGPLRRFSDFFRPFSLLHRRSPAIRSLADFFPGAFAYQWHGLWAMPEREHSYFGMFEREIEARIGRKISRRTAPA